MVYDFTVFLGNQSHLFYNFRGDFACGKFTRKNDGEEKKRIINIG